MRLLIKGGTALDPAHNIEGAMDILCQDGRIAAIAPGLSAPAERVIDATGCLVFPALIDMHAHTGEPGNEPRESLSSFAQAALRGGFGTALLMPDTNPPRQNLTDLRTLLDWSATLPIRILAAACLTKERSGEEPTEWGELAEGGAAAIGDGRPVVDSGLIRRALLYLRQWDLPLLVDAMDTNLSKNATAWEGYHATIFGLRGMPAAAEECMVVRDLILSRLTGGRLHIQRVATKEAVARIAEAKAQGVPVTAEVSWLHLLKTTAALESYDTSLKLWPPLGDEGDRQALLDGVRTGVIDAIVTDHTPYAMEEKDVEFDLAPWGAAGVEHALAALWTELVSPGVLDAATLIARLTEGPAAALGIDFEGFGHGAPADLVVFDPTDAWMPSGELQASWAVNHPYTGVHLGAKVRATVVGGVVQYEAGR